MSTSPSTERAKLLTRARNILLDQSIYNAAQVTEAGQDALLTIPNVGPAMAEIIWDAATGLSSSDQEYLFPYPNGPENTRPYSAVDAAAGKPDELPDESHHVAVTYEQGSISTSGLVRALHGLRTNGPAWADGYLSALIDGAEGSGGISASLLDAMDRYINPRPALAPFLSSGMFLGRISPTEHGGAAPMPKVPSATERLLDDLADSTATVARNGVARMDKAEAETAGPPPSNYAEPDEGC